jgi:hypothetical protein
LLLPPGRYHLDIDAGEVGAEPASPWLVVRPEGAVTRRRPMEQGSGTRVGAFEIEPGEGAVTLLLDGGGPFVVKQIRLRASTLGADSGLTP